MVAPSEAHRAQDGGEGGIRTPGELSPTEVFKTSAIDHSATSPVSRGEGHASASRGRAFSGPGAPRFRASRGVPTACGPPPVSYTPLKPPTILRGFLSLSSVSYYQSSPHNHRAYSQTDNINCLTWYKLD